MAVGSGDRQARDRGGYRFFRTGTPAAPRTLGAIQQARFSDRGDARRDRDDDDAGE